MKQQSLIGLLTDVTKIHLFSPEEVAQIGSVKEAVAGMFDFAISKRDLYPEVIATRAGIAKGTISALRNGSELALSTHKKRPDLMTACDNALLHQWEGSKLGLISFHQTKVFELLNKLEQQETMLRQYGLVAPAERQVSR